MLNLYYRNRHGELALVRRNVAKDDFLDRYASSPQEMKRITNLIRTDVKARSAGFKIYYIRTWREDDSLVFDISSWFEFYILKTGRKEDDDGNHDER